MRDSHEVENEVLNEVLILAGCDELHRRTAAPGQARRGRCRAEEQNHRDGQHDKFLQVCNHGRASGLESGTLILRLSWLTLPYHARSSMPRGPGGPPRSKAGERSGVGPQRRRGDDRLFDMSASQAFEAGVAFHHVHAGHGGRISEQANACSSLGGSFARSAGKRDGSSGGCG